MSEGPLDPHRVVELLEEKLLGGHPTMTGQEVADAVGISLDVARLRWRSLGFTAVPDDEIAFTEADLNALRLTQRMHELGIITVEDEAALIRTVGRSFARLAEWQMGVLGGTIDPEHVRLDDIADLVDEIAPLIESVQRYVWRRHVLGAASRMLLAPPIDEEDRAATAIGFADIVGYTRQSRSLSQEELARLVEDFEGQAQTIITAHGGRIIKTIGDEVLFAADTPHDAAHIALELVEGHQADPDFPQLRVGVAWGPVLNRLGDVFGPTVNLAARLTSVARPGRVLIDKEMAEAVEDDEDFKLRRMRRISVKGYRRLEPWVLRRPVDEDELPPVAAQIYERGQDLLRGLDEFQGRAERPTGAEGAEESPDR